MGKENKHRKPKDTEQAKHFTGAPDPLPPEVDEAFWRANRNLLDALRDHESSRGDDNPAQQ